MNHPETSARGGALWSAALLLCACGGGETPAVNPALAETIALEYGSGASRTGNGNGSGSGSLDTPGLDDADSDMDGDAANPPAMELPDPGDDEPADEPMTPPDTEDTEPEPSAGAPDCDGFTIVQENCGQSGCHGGSSNLGNFAESEASARGYIGRNGALTCASQGPIIDPENPSDSVLVLKLSDDPPCGNYMPPSGAFLPASDVECITNWIANLE